MQRRKFIALPDEDTFHLTPKLWMAVGLVAYNYYLMTLRPLQILATSRDARHIPPTRIEAAARGIAVMVSTDGLSPATRSAVSEIARSLLLPFGLYISHHGGSPIRGGGRTKSYFFIEDTDTPEHIALPQLMPQADARKVAV